MTEREERDLSRAARQSGIPERELIRRGIELAQRASALELDERAWKRERRFIKSRARIQSMKKGRAWSREELYDERLSRISR